MPPSAEPLAPPARWGTWLHALWGERVTLQWLEAATPAGAQRPVLVGAGGGEGALYLPPSGVPEPRRAAAATAHAAAHWRFGGLPQARAGLKPVQQALFEVLEDARVETLALRELPGLRALWLPFHAGDDAPAGNEFAALLARLARCLLDPGWTDPHPWVVRARAAAHPASGFALATPADVRGLASRLGNDIGQMRLPFNARGYRAHAAYRDDGSWLWQPEAHAPASDTALAAQAAAGARPDTAGQPAQASARPPESASGEAAGADAAPATLYPEWDERIARYRPGWCRVHTCAATEAVAQPRFAAAAGEGRRLARALARLRGGPPRAAGRARWGDDFHAMALLDAHLQQRAGQPPDPHVYRHRVAPPQTLAVQLLLDTSASTADAGADGRPLLAHMLEAALTCVAALEEAGHRSALLAFASRGRQRVEVRPLKHWGEAAAAPQVLARCAGQRSGGSTRMGAALRHATGLALAQAREHGAARPLVLVLSDGEPHDVDAPDPAYLRGDLRRAIAEAEARGVAVRCLLVPPAGAAGAAPHLRGLPPGQRMLLRQPAGMRGALATLLAT